MILTFEHYIEVKKALIKYFVDNDIKYNRTRPKKFFVDCGLCRNDYEAKIINKVFLNKKATMLTLIDKIIFLHYVKYNTIFQSANGDLQRLEGITGKQKWKSFKKIYHEVQK